MQVGLERRLVGAADLVQHVADLVRPTALDGDVGERRGQGGEQARAAIDAEHLETLAGQPAAHQIAQELLPLGGALGAGQAEVDDLLLAIGAKQARIIRSTSLARLA